MEKINDFINRTNPNKSISNVNKIDSSVIATEQKNDSFKKKENQNNKQRNIIITAVIAGVLAIVAFFKRKDISAFFNNLFKKSADIQTKTPEIKPIDNVPVDKIASKSSFEIQGLSDSALTQMQSALDDLTIRVNDKQLNSGVGFISENLEKREEAMTKFLDKLTENNYEIIKIPTIDEKSPEEISKAIVTSIAEAETKFQQTGKRTVLVIRDLDVVANNGEVGAKYMDVAAAIQDNVEHCKEKGFTWVWDANKFDNIDQPIGGKRTAHKVFM